jgi:hypothetical protein
MASAPRIGIVLLALFEAACRPAISDERRQDGRFVEVVSSSARMPCRASIDYADQFIEHWAREFGTTPPRVRSFVDESLRDQICPLGMDGVRTECAIGEETYSAGWVQEHELIHVIAGAGFGRAPALFEEGLAVWASEGGDHRGRYVGDRSVDLAPLFESARWNAAPNAPARYTAAGHFVGYLAERFGLRAFLRVYDALENNAARRTIESVILQQLGVALDVLLADWRRLAEPPRVDATSTRLLCALAPRSSTEVFLPASRATCATDLLQTGLEHRAVLQGLPGLLRMRATEPFPRIALGDCGRNTRLYDSFLPHFFFTAYSDTLIATTVGGDVRAERVASSPARCEDAVVLDLESLDDARVLADPRSWASVGGERRTWIRVRHTSARALQATIVFDLNQPESVSTLLRCDSCAPDARCVPRSAEPLSISTSPDSAEVLVWSTTDAAVTVALSVSR